MSFLKGLGLQWFEWLGIGIVVLMLSVGYLVWNKYDERTLQVGGLSTANEVLTETVKYKDQSATISDQVVAEFVKEKEDVKVELQQSREGVIDDYINMAERSTTEAVKPVVVVPAKPAKNQPPEVQVRATEPKIDNVSDTARISVLAERMHEHYCKAAPERGIGCNADSTNK